MTVSVPELSVFERIVTGDDVEQWCLRVLQKWAGTYLAEVERQHGLTAGALPRPRSWGLAPSLDNWPEDQLPGVVLVSVGLSENPLKTGDGSYRARWSVGLAAICSARSQDESRRLAMLYVAALRAVLIQRPSLEGKALGVVWLDENYDELVFDDTRSLMAGQATFTVEIGDVTTTGVGPRSVDDPHDPDTDPWADWPTVQTHHELVEKED